MIAQALQSLRPVVGYEGAFSVCESGHIYSHQRNRFKKLSPSVCNSGYMKIRLRYNNVGRTVYVHRLIAEAFLGSVKGVDVNHIDGNKLNNCVTNLEIASRAENMAHARANNLWNPSNNGSVARRVVPDSIVLAARGEYSKGKRGHGVRAIAKKYGVSKTVMENILTGASYKEIM